MQPNGQIGADLGIRTRSAVILGVVVLAVTWLGGWAFGLFCAGLAGLVLWEWRQMAGFRSSIAIEGDMVVTGALAVASAAFVGPAVGLAIGAVIALISGALEATARRSQLDLWAGLWAIFGVAYAILPTIALNGLRGGGDIGLVAVIFLFGVVWTTDIAAYFTGRILGGPKLLPQISPKKTWSGAIGGLIGGIVAGGVIGAVAGEPRLVPALCLAAVVSVTAQAGDLFESWVKRRFSVKDSGRLIPGHGGVMDRVDGLLAAALLLAAIGWARTGLASAASGALLW